MNCNFLFASKVEVLKEQKRGFRRESAGGRLKVVSLKIDIYSHFVQ